MATNNNGNRSAGDEEDRVQRVDVDAIVNQEDDWGVKEADKNGSKEEEEKTEVFEANEECDEKRVCAEQKEYEDSIAKFTSVEAAAGKATTDANSDANYKRQIVSEEMIACRNVSDFKKVPDETLSSEKQKHLSVLQVPGAFSVTSQQQKQELLQTQDSATVARRVAEEDKLGQDALTNLVNEKCNEYKQKKPESLELESSSIVAASVNNQNEQSGREQKENWRQEEQAQLMIASKQLKCKTAAQGSEGQQQQQPQSSHTDEKDAEMKPLIDDKVLPRVSWDPATGAKQDQQTSQGQEATCRRARQGFLQRTQSNNILVEANVVENDGLTAEEFIQLEAQFRQKFIQEAIIAEPAPIDDDDKNDSNHTTDVDSVANNTFKNRLVLLFILMTVVIVALVVSLVLARGDDRGEMPVDDESIVTEGDYSAILLANDTSHSRLVAYIGNWQPCPTAEQVKEYTHIIIGFAVSYQWAEGKNDCSQTCEISTPPVCTFSQATRLVQEWKNSGKKVMLSFGGTGMGTSSDGGINDCWEYCYGRETQVVSQLTDIVSRMDLDGVDLSYTYFYEDYQGGSNFNKSVEAVHFLEEVTLGLRRSLPAGSLLTHSVADADVTLGTGYFYTLKDIAHSLDFLMVQYYKGITRPNLYGIDGEGNWSSTVTIDHYSTLVYDMFDGDAKKIVFGFCIDVCGDHHGGWNTNGEEAADIMVGVSSYFSCNGGAMFWVAKDDVRGAWSRNVSNAMSKEGEEEVCA